MTVFEWTGLLAFIALGLGFVVHMYQGSVDSLRLDALQTYNWQVGCIDGQFGVLAGSPPKMLLGTLKPSVREAIDAALVEREAQRG